MKDFDLHNTILSLPNGYQTSQSQFSSQLTSFQIFLIGLARSVLTKSEIIAIYEIPVGLSKDECVKLNKILNNLKKERTILIFSATNSFTNNLNNHFIVESGHLTIKKVNN